jgi:transcriptional regulator with XRE-family HTH domain
MKQGSLAFELGISQQAVSKIEQSESVEDETLERVAKVLGVSAEAIKNFDEEKAIHNIQNNYDNAVIHGGPTINNNCTFNPIEKIVTLYEEKIAVMERLLLSEKEKIEYLERLLKEKK